MKGITKSTLDRLELIMENLKMGRLNLKRLSHLAWFCEQMREVVYDIYEELLKQGDEVKAIKVFEELYLPFERMAELFESISEEEEGFEPSKR